LLQISSRARGLYELFACQGAAFLECDQLDPWSVCAMDEAGVSMLLLALAPKILAVVLAVIVVSKSYIDFRLRVESLPMFLFWAVTWTVIVIIALFPTTIDLVIAYFGRG